MNIYKGDIFYIMKPLQFQTTGSEQDAGRPAIIVSNDIGNEYSEIVEVVYLTTRDKKPLPTHCEVMCHVPSTALCEQIQSVSKDRIGNYIRSCTEEEMAAIDNALMVSLGIGREPQPFTQAEVRLATECNLLKKELDELKRSDNVSNLPYRKEDIMQLEVERDFYKSQFEQLFERVVGKAVQA